MHLLAQPRPKQTSRSPHQLRLPSTQIIVTALRWVPIPPLLSGVHTPLPAQRRCRFQRSRERGYAVAEGMSTEPDVHLESWLPFAKLEGFAARACLNCGSEPLPPAILHIPCRQWGLRASRRPRMPTAMIRMPSGISRGKNRRTRAKRLLMTGDGWTVWPGAGEVMCPTLSPGGDPPAVRASAADLELLARRGWLAAGSGPGKPGLA
jgi:hypothetical protein